MYHRLDDAISKIIEKLMQTPGMRISPRPNDVYKLPVIDSQTRLYLYKFGSVNIIGNFNRKEDIEFKGNICLDFCNYLTRLNSPNSVLN